MHGADFENFKDSENQDNSLLHMAAKSGNKELIDFLKQNNIDLDV